MFWLQQLALAQLLTFTLVLTRVSGVVMLAPIFGGADVPARIRVLMAVGLSVLATPLAGFASPPSASTLVDFSLLIVAEALIGLVLGLGVMLLFSGIQVAGQVIAQVSGMQLADVLNPALDANVPVFSQLLYLLSLAVFVLIGGHCMVIEALLDTFHHLPLGSSLSHDVVDTLTALLTQSLALGVRAAAPTMAAVLLATLVLALISRTLPQLNVMAVGFGASAIVTLAALAFTLGAVAWIFEAEVGSLLELAMSALDG